MVSGRLWLFTMKGVQAHLDIYITSVKIDEAPKQSSPSFTKRAASVLHPPPLLTIRMGPEQVAVGDGSSSTTSLPCDGPLAHAPAGARPARGPGAREARRRARIPTPNKNGQ